MIDETKAAKVGAAQPSWSNRSGWMKDRPLNGWSRSTDLSLAYNFAVTIFGGFAAVIATLLIEETGSKLAPRFYVIAAAVVSALTLLAIRDRTGLPID